MFVGILRNEMKRRSFLTMLTVPAMALAASEGRSRGLPGTVVFTFDGWSGANPLGSRLLLDRQIKATIFVDPNAMWPVQKDWHLTPSQLADLSVQGQEVGIYSGHNLLRMFTAADGSFDEVGAAEYISRQKTAMRAHGYDCKTYAAGARKWNAALANATRGLFDGARVASDPINLQRYPIPDPLFVSQGGYASLNDATASGALAKMDECAAAGALLILVFHNIATTGDAGYNIGVSSAAAIFDHAVALRSSGHRICSFHEALTPP